MTFQAFVDKVALYWTSLIVRLLRAIQLLIKKKKKKSNSARVLEIIGLLDCGHYSHSVTCSHINTSPPEYKNKRKVLCLYVFLTPMLNDLSPKRQFYNVIGQSLSVSGVNDA